MIFIFGKKNKLILMNIQSNVGIKLIKLNEKKIKR